MLILLVESELSDDPIDPIEQDHFDTISVAKPSLRERLSAGKFHLS